MWRQNSVYIAGGIAKGVAAVKTGKKLNKILLRSSTSSFRYKHKRTKSRKKIHSYYVPS